MAKSAVLVETNGQHTNGNHHHHHHHHHSRAEAFLPEQKVRFIPLSYSADHGGEEADRSSGNASARALIQALRPEWGTEIEFKRFTDGITNTLLQARPPKTLVQPRAGETIDDAQNREAILLRAYGNGTDLLIDRNREAQNHELLSRHRLAPELLALFENGMLYRFIRGRVTTPQDLRSPDIYLAVARRLAQWHSTVPCLTAAAPTSPPTVAADSIKNKIRSVAPGKPTPNVWTIMQKWIIALPTDTEAQRERQASLQKELDRLVAELSQRPGLGKDGLVFAHCDLLSGNVIILPPEPAVVGDSEGHANGNGVSNGTPKLSVTFIDYEYATPSPAAFDLANHFAEWGGFDCDFSVLPTRAQRRKFIREYVRSYFHTIPGAGATAAEEAADGEAADRLFAEVDLFRGVPGFYWGIWALIQATISDIDFDYASYAETRLGEYWAWRAEQDGSRAAEGREMPLREQRWAQEE